MTDGRERDVQKQNVYEFEDEFGEYSGIQGEQLSLAECQELVNVICAHHGVHPPKVTDGRGRKSAVANALWIRLPKIYRNLIAVAHECAHVIVDSLPGGDELAYHGPLFVRYVIEIICWRLSQQKGTAVSDAGLLSYAEICGVEVAPVTEYRRAAPDLGDKVLELLQDVEVRSCELDELESRADDVRSQLEAAYGRIDIEMSEVRRDLFP